MDNINDQSNYWNKVAATKTFTHPLDIGLIKQYMPKTAMILDYGCGYGRLTSEMYLQGFTNITGVDTSIELIDRGKKTFLVLICNISKTQQHCLLKKTASI